MKQKLPLFLILFSVSVTAFSQATVYHNEWINYSKTYYKCKVMGFGSDSVGAPVRKGIVRISYSSLSSAGMAGIASENFQLWRDGEEVAIYVSKATGPLGTNDYIEFVGEINNGKLDQELYRNPDYQLNDKWSLQTDTATYFFTENTTSPNKRFESVTSDISNNTLPAANYFMHTAGRYYRSDISDGFSASLGKTCTRHRMIRVKVLLAARSGLLPVAGLPHFHKTFTIYILT